MRFKRGSVDTAAVSTRSGRGRSCLRVLAEDRILRSMAMDAGVLLGVSVLILLVEVVVFLCRTLVT